MARANAARVGRIDPRPYQGFENGLRLIQRDADIAVTDCWHEGPAARREAPLAAKDVVANGIGQSGYLLYLLVADAKLLQGRAEVLDHDVDMGVVQALLK